jgi:hypothetical protein
MGGTWSLEEVYRGGRRRRKEGRRNGVCGLILYGDPGGSLSASSLGDTPVFVCKVFILICLGLDFILSSAGLKTMARRTSRAASGLILVSILQDGA